MSSTNPLDSAAKSDRTIPIRSRGPLVLVVDLDTLARGKHNGLAQLSAKLRQRPHTSIIYAAPARGVRSAQTCVEVLHLPAADVVVADWGASVQPARPHATLDALDATIGERWPGSYEVRTRVAALGHMLGEHRREDARRMTYFPQRDVSIEDARFAVERVLNDLDVYVQVSEAQEIDVLPGGTDMATTVTRTVHALRADPSCVVIAGAFVEPQFFHDTAYWGVATGDVPAHVRTSLSTYPRVHIAKADGPRGVFDGLHALGFFKHLD